MTDGLAPIVVGVDGTASGRGALRWAADEAVRLEPTWSFGEPCFPAYGRTPR